MALGHLLFLFVIIASVSARQVNFYRRDYVYLEEYDAFYKLHTDDNVSDTGAGFRACDDEGAELFYPKTKEDLVVVKKLMETLSDTPNITNIFVGIHNTFGLSEFITINGLPTPVPIINADSMLHSDSCVMMNVETGVLQSQLCHQISPPHLLLPLYNPEQTDGPPEDLPNTSIPFVCKKSKDVSCPTIDSEYKYYKGTDKCYKVNNKELTWDKAMETCFMEGGILLVINNSFEEQIVSNNLRGENEYFAGFKKLFGNDDFYTVTGKKLKDSGFPDRMYTYENKHKCGAVKEYNSMVYLKMHECIDKLPFICEMQVTNTKK